MNIRNCLFCGCDISNKNKNAIICGSKRCKQSYDKWRRENKQRETHRYCIICGKNIDNFPPQSKICDNIECLKERNKRNYKENLKLKKCKICGKDFEATEKQTLCEVCRSNFQKYNIYDEITQKIICKDCGILINTVKKQKSSRVSDVKYDLCVECKNKRKNIFRKSASLRLSLNNPMFNKTYVEQMRKTKRAQYINNCIINNKEIKEPFVRKEHPETKEETKLRMKLNNPMFNESIRNKAITTLKNRIQNGEITYKRGKDNPSWKGNRCFNRSVRLKLKQWVKEKFKENNYTCQLCNKTNTELHVHHIKPLRDIINEHLEAKNISIEYVNNINGTEEYFKIIEEIVNYHFINMDIGVVVCPECHSKIDKQYRRKTYDKINKEKEL